MLGEGRGYCQSGTMPLLCITSNFSTLHCFKMYHNWESCVLVEIECIKKTICHITIINTLYEACYEVIGKCFLRGSSILGILLHQNYTFIFLEQEGTRM
jgi:hypothetical protein